MAGKLRNRRNSAIAVGAHFRIGAEMLALHGNGVDFVIRDKNALEGTPADSFLKKSFCSSILLTNKIAEKNEIKKI